MHNFKKIQRNFPKISQIFGSKNVKISQKFDLKNI